MALYFDLGFNWATIIGVLAAALLIFGAMTDKKKKDKRKQLMTFGVVAGLVFALPFLVVSLQDGKTTLQDNDMEVFPVRGHFQITD